VGLQYWEGFIMDIEALVKEKAQAAKEASRLLAVMKPEDKSATVEDAIKSAENKLKDNNGNWIDEAIKYIGGVVIGLIVIGALILMFRTKIIQGLEAKITEIFNIK